MLQLRVQEELLGTWTVKYLVGASYSYKTHTGYFKMSRDNAVMGSICDCFSERVVGTRKSVFWAMKSSSFFYDNFFQSSRACSHLFAVLRLLVDFNDQKVDTLLVRRVELF